MKVIKTVSVDTVHTVELTHKEVEMLKKAMGKSTEGYPLFMQLDKLLKGDN